MPEEIRADLLLGRDTLSPGLLKAGQAASDASSNVRQLTRDLYEVSKQRATPVVDLNDATATAKVADISQKIRDLSAKVASPEVSLDDKDAAAKVADMRVKLDTLGKKVSSPRVTLEGVTRAEAQVLKLDLMLDELSRKHAAPSVDVNQRGGLLSRITGLFGGGGAAAGAGGGGLAAALGGGGLTAAAIAALALAPAAIPLFLGGGTAGAGALGALKLDPQLLKGVEESLKSSSRGALKSGPGLTGTTGGIFGSATGGSGSFLSGLVGILKQLSGFIKSVRPQLSDLFRASLPFAQAFVKVLEQFAKAVLPAMTQSLKELTPDLPILIQGFKLLAQGIAGFLVNLGPGMKDSAIIFKAAMEVVKGLLQLTGAAASDFAIGIVKTAEFVRNVAREIPPFFDKMRHDIAQIFDNLRHDTAAIWDAIWRDTIGKVQAGYRTVVRWFQNLPGSVRAALGGFGKMLLGIATGSMGDFLSGLKSVGGSILSWIKNFFAGIPKAILSLLHMSPPHPGSVFFDLGANFMHHLEAGIQSRARSVIGRIGSVVGNAIGHGTGATAGGIQGLAFQIAKARGWANQWGAIEAVEMAEAGWNLTARNPSSGAYGIAQFINGPSEYYQWGGNPNTAIGQITAFYNYIASRYGTPSAAAAHEARFHWYDKGGWLPTGMSIAVNNTGRPEQVLPPGGGAGHVVIEVRGNDSETSQFLVRLLKRHVRQAGGGNVQTAFATTR